MKNLLTKLSITNKLKTINYLILSLLFTITTLIPLTTNTANATPLPTDVPEHAWTVGTNDGRFQYPNGVTTDASGNVYVADSDNNRIQKFDSSGTFLAKWGTYGSADGEFDSPFGITTDSSGNVYVADTGNNRIQKFAYPSEEPETPEEPSSDSDGIPDSVENSSPNSGDANNDGIADSTQANVASYVNPVTNSYVVLQTSSECSITTTTTTSEDNLTIKDSGYNYPVGLTNFTTDCNTPGFTATINLYYYNLDSTNYTLRKHNPNNNSFLTIANPTLTNLTIDNKPVTKVTYQVTDGQQLDIDNTTNGTIVDPVGLATLAVGSPNTGLR